MVELADTQVLGICAKACRFESCRRYQLYKGEKGMSYYYNYFIGYESGGKIYPLGPYDSFGKLRYVVSKSRSFASDLHNDFYYLAKDEYSDELLKEFSYETYDGKTEWIPIKYLPIGDLPTGDFINKGYFLIDDVRRYEETGDNFDLFYDSVSPTVYAAMLEHEMKFGKSERYKDEYDEWVQPKSASDYMYYAYLDTDCKEFEAFIIAQVADELWSYSTLPKDAKMFILETEG